MIDDEGDPLDGELDDDLECEDFDDEEHVEPVSVEFANAITDFADALLERSILSATYDNTSFGLYPGVVRYSIGLVPRDADNLDADWPNVAMVRFDAEHWADLSWHFREIAVQFVANEKAILEEREESEG